MKILQGKRVLITGVLNNSSIAAGIARACHEQGAELAFTYQSERFADRLSKLSEELGGGHCVVCDVSDDAQIDAAAAAIAEHWPEGLDCVVHSIGFAPVELLSGDFCDVTTREGFHIAHDISSYSFVALCRAFRPYLRDNASLLTLTYLGSQRMVPSYNVMGLAKASLEASVRYLAASFGSSGMRVNAISAGPIRTLASAGIGNFRKMQSYAEKRSMLERNVSTAEVGNAAAFLLSDMASSVTATTLYVDSGLHSIVVSPVDLENQQTTEAGS